MVTKTLHRYLVVVVAVGLRSARRWQRTGGPKLRVVVQAAVRVAGGDGEYAVVLAVHVLAAAATGAAVTIAAAFATGPAAQLLEIARVVAIAAVAVSAAVILVRHARGSARLRSVRPLILATARRIDSSQTPGLAALALQLACDPRLLWAGPNPIRLVLRHAAQHVISHVAQQPLASLPALIGPALNLFGAYRTTIDNARFVRDFALTAVELSAGPRLLALN
jgi:hypothetical protein